MKHLLTIFLFTSSILVFGQSVFDNDSLFKIGFEEYVSNPKSLVTSDSIIYIEKPDRVTSIPNSVGGKKVVVINANNYIDLFKRNGKRLSILVVSPIIVENEKLKLVFTPYSSELVKRKNIHKILSDWTSVYFTYNSSTKNWDILKVESGGI